MNQLFNTVYYFEFQAFKALRKSETSRRLQAHAGITPHFLIVTFSLLLLTFLIMPGNKKPPRHSCPAAF